MAPSALFIVYVLLLTCLASSDAFAGHSNRASIQNSRAHAQFARLHPSNRRLQKHDTTSSQTTTLHAKNSKNDDTQEKRQYTNVEDGSPLGVAIVLIGSLIVLGGDEEWQSPTSSSVWIVFATASIAAGLARLVRYVKDKNE